MDRKTGPIFRGNFDRAEGVEVAILKPILGTVSS